MNPGSEQAVAPTGRHKLLYYTLGLTPPVEHADWVRRDIGSPGWKVRRGLQFVISMTVGAAIAAAILDSSPGLLLGIFVGAILGAFIQVVLMQNYVRRRTFAYYEKRWARESGS